MVAFVVVSARVPHTQGDRVLVACIEVPAVGCRSTAVISISVRGDRSCLVSEKTVKAAVVCQATAVLGKTYDAAVVCRATAVTAVVCWAIAVISFCVQEDCSCCSLSVYRSDLNYRRRRRLLL